METMSGNNGPKLTRSVRRVLFVNFSSMWGGGEKWHLISARELLHRDYQVMILANRKSLLAERAFKEGIPCQTLPLSNLSWLNPSAFVELTRIFHSFKPESVIINGSRELKTAGIAAKWAQTSQIIYRRGIPRSINPGWLNTLFFRHVVTGLLANSNNTAQAFRKILEASDKSFPEIIYNGIDTQNALRSNPHSRTIGIVARLSHEKGVDLAIQAMAKVKNYFPDVKLLIIGDGPDLQALQQLTAQLNLQQHIEFVGFTEQVSPQLQQCSILLNTSRWEGFSHALLEGMLLRMPCVAFGAHNSHESIVHGETGYLVEPFELARLAERVVELLRQPEKIIAMGEAGYHRVCQHFSLTHSIDRLEELLQGKSLH